MSLSEAVQILMDMAGRWGENAEEEFTRRINAEDTNEDLEKITLSKGELERAIEIRDLWMAVKIVEANLNKIIEGAPR
jgi:hypothetical protein